MFTDLIYVYCLSRKHLAELPALVPAGLKCIPVDGYDIIIKYVSSEEFSEENLQRNISDMAWLDMNAREHMQVISLLMDACTVIPFKFGTIYHSMEGLEKFIRDYSDSFNATFQQIEGKLEWSVKIFCDRKGLSDRIDELSDEAAELEKQIMASSPGKAFLLKRKKSDLVRDELDRLCKYYGQSYFNELKNLSDSVCLNNLLPKEFTGRQDSMILNSTFLVRKDKFSSFASTIGAFRKRDGDSGFFIEVTGPWPPFSFISINEKQ
jgi:hypothetical protein